MAFLIGSTMQCRAAKTNSNSYNEIGSFMAQPSVNVNSNSRPQGIGTSNFNNVNSSSLNMQVPSYHSPYSKAPVIPNVSVQNIPPSNFSVGESSNNLEPSRVNTNDSSVNVVKNVPTKETINKNLTKSSDTKVDLKTNKTNKDDAKSFKFSFDEYWKKMKNSSNKVKYSLKKISFSKKNKIQNKSDKNINSDKVQTVFETEKEYETVEYTGNNISNIHSPKLRAKVNLPNTLRKSVVPTPTLADTMITNDVYNAGRHTTLDTQTEQIQSLSVQKVTSNTDEVAVASNKTNVQIQDDKDKSLKFVSSLKKLREKNIEVDIEKQTDLTFNEAIEKHSTASNVTNANDEPNMLQDSSMNLNKDDSVKNDNKFFAKLKKEKNSAKSEVSSQDKLDAIEEIRDYAKILYNANNIEESLEQFNNISDADKISDDWLFLANIAQDRNKLEDAIFYLKKSIQLDDTNYKAHYNLGNIYMLQNKTNAALSEYKKVNKIKKDFAYAYYNKGCCYLKNNNYFNARYEFGLAIKYNPDDPVFYYNLAYTNKMMKKEKKAQEALDVYNRLMNE